MKMVEALNAIDRSWIKKKEGFRVVFQKKSGAEFITEHCPGEAEKPMDSNVAAWRLAWKLAQAGKPCDDKIRDGDMVNIHVVDETGARVRYYATNDFDVFNLKDIS
jgi:hypothetical protein